MSQLDWMAKLGSGHASGQDGIIAIADGARTHVLTLPGVDGYLVPLSQPDLAGAVIDRAPDVPVLLTGDGITPLPTGIDQALHDQIRQIRSAAEGHVTIPALGLSTTLAAATATDTVTLALTQPGILDISCTNGGWAVKGDPAANGEWTVTVSAQHLRDAVDDYAGPVTLSYSPAITGRTPATLLVDSDGRTALIGPLA